VTSKREKACALGRRDVLAMIAAPAVGSFANPVSAKAVVANGGAPPAALAGPQVQVTPLHRADVPELPGWELVVVTAVISGDDIGPWHYHNGYEANFVLEGSAMFQAEGQEQMHFKSGDLNVVSPGVRHRGGGGSRSHPYKLLSFILREKDKPPATPVDS